MWQRKNKCYECNPFYKLIDGKCILDYSINATYSTNDTEKEINLINNIFWYYIRNNNR